MTAQRLVRLTIDHRDDVLGRGQRLAYGDRRRELRRGGLRERRGGGRGEFRHGIMHRLQERRHFRSRCAGMGIAKPCDGQLGGKVDRVGSIGQGILLVIAGEERR